MPPLLEWIARILLAYLLGSVNGSLLLGRLRGVDIRTMGSGNAGGTNALRTQGLWFALAAIVIDVTKGYVAAHLLAQGSGMPAWLPEACGAGAVVGHVYPIWHGLRGGKGAATLLGVLAALAPWMLGVALIVWLLCMFLTGYVGLSTMLASAAVPLAAMIRGAEPAAPRVLMLTALAVFVVFTHRANIARMRAGREPRSRRLWLLGRLLG
jgi:acyl phosphate:glycerol-3-phosphate acyltransferase